MFENYLFDRTLSVFREKTKAQEHLKTGVWIIWYFLQGIESSVSLDPVLSVAISSNKHWTGQRTFVIIGKKYVRKPVVEPVKEI